MRKRFYDLIGDVIDVSIQKRSRHSVQPSNQTVPVVCLTDDSCYHLESLDSETQHLLASIRFAPVSDIIPRGKARTPKICLPGGQTNNLRSKSYPSVGTLGASKTFYRVAKSTAKQGLCATLPLLSGTRIPAIDYVVEHVTELQTPAQYANNMIKGLLSSSAKATSAGYNWASIFGSGGIFQQTFSKSGIKLPAGLTGSTPEEAIFNAFGTTKDNTNLLILDALTNSVKTSAWSLFQNVIGDNKWKAASPASRIELILRLYEGLIDYMNTADAQKSLEYTYNAQQAIWKAFDTAAGSANTALQPLTGGTNFVLQHRAWYADFFLEFSGNLQTFLHNKMTQEVTYWTSPQAVKDYSAPAAKIITASLRTKLANLGTDVVVKTGWLK